ncbi:OmpA family protein [Sedimentitalea nanhaiensis]|uniref:OmpA-OmpF porin, OOP family n=1 Tax=Sedimentitalea nanhaiensis TaxID=999627 RepID=A0A1I6Z2A0_9RHOB|nr:OmpA family protein [Sedimentitalea nanhaiensis]SFT56511.1 OmpA-OmpF porin, OOP family [Sedimentitalea nanhaiensis]
MIRRFVPGCVALLLPLCAAAQDLSLPATARQLANRVSPLDSYALPVGPYDGKSVPSRQFEGRIERQTWRIDGAAQTTLQLLQPLRDQVTAAGFDLMFECRDRDCGGFDFRFETEVVPAPDMQVDIRNFRFLSAVRDPDQAISLLVSRSRTAAYIQIIRVVPIGDTPLAVVPGEGVVSAPTGTDPTDPIAGLMAQGHVILRDLDFATGADALGAGPYASLDRLAEHLRDNPGLRIALVGHTDSAGALDTNITLSKRRAEAVRVRLIRDYGITPARIEAEGMGYLAPVASNLTPEGRETNRRVEAIVLSDG